MAALTNVQILSAKPKEKPYKLFDTGGLYLHVQTNGGRWWRLKYRYADKEQSLSLGTYPDTSLTLARKKRDESRKLLADGVNPSARRKAEKVSHANTFKAVALEWLELQRKSKSPRTIKKTTGILERHLFPRIGSKPLASVLPPDILDAVRRVEARGNRETAHRTLSYASQVFRYGVATSVVTSDPTRDLRGALAPIVTTHRAAITEPEEVGALLRAIDGYGGTPSTAAALKLAPLVFVRPGELRGARWEEFDLDGKEPLWSIPGKRMKMREDHMVPLSTQATDILKELRSITGPDGLVFPGERSSVRPISDGTLNAALRRLGYDKEQMTAHGFRAIARTLLDERLHVRLDYIEHQSAHAVRDANGRAYNRTTHLDERRKMMQKWADYLDELRAGAKVVPIRKTG